MSGSFREGAFLVALKANRLSMYIFTLLLCMLCVCAESRMVCRMLIWIPHFGLVEFEVREFPVTGASFDYDFVCPLVIESLFLCLESFLFPSVYRSYKTPICQVSSYHL